MAISLQGVGSAPAMAAVSLPRLEATETKTTEVVIENPDRVVYRETETKETGWSDIVLTVLDKTVSILAGLGKIVSLPLPNLAELF